MSQINIDLIAIKDIAVKGVRRTALFMGLGINAANDPNYRQYELAKTTEYEFIEPISDEGKLAEVKAEFGRWIVSNGLRELSETYCVFLDEIHLVCLIAAVVRGEIQNDQIKRKNSIFKRYGMENKFKHLYDDFGLQIKQSDYLTTIQQARHCLTHRQGIVGREDCTEGNELAVRWRGIDIIAETPSGDKISLSPVSKEIPIPKGSEIGVTFSDRKRLFPLKSLLAFSPRELAEICLFTLNAADEAILSLQRHLKESGTPLTNSRATPYPPPPNQQK